jgi:outer membrane protein TolC
MPYLRPIRHAACVALAFSLALAPAARAQVSLSTAVDLALRNNPRVLSAQDDVARARAQLAEAHDVYIPNITAGAGIGQGYGYLPSPPTLFEITAGSLVFSGAQFFYVRSAKEGIHAAEFSLEDVREAVAQDTALAFITLDHDQKRERVIGQQTGFASTLISIVQARVDAGQDSQIDLTQAKLTAAQLHLAALKAQDDIANDRDHLARLIALPSTSLQIDSAFPATPFPDAPNPIGPYTNSAVASAFASAAARQQQARGDARFQFWPQISMFTQYNRYATWTSSFKTLENLNNTNSSTHIGADEAAFGVQITLPFFDNARDAKARQTAADASKALHDAQNAQIDALDGESRTRHGLSELQAQSDVATLQQQLAQQQLDVLRLQLQSGTGNPQGPQMSPKDEQTARIGERDKFLAVLDAAFQLRQAQIQLLRQTGQLESWLHSATGPTAPRP